MSRPIQPFLQGELDHLCGLYAITNALRWAMRELSPLSRSNSVELISTLADDLQVRGISSGVFSDGITIPDLGRSLKTAVAWLRKETGYSAVVRKPLHGVKTRSLRKLTLTAGWHLSFSNTSVIIGAAGRSDHWTVITGVNAKTLMLFDSEGQKFYRRRNCFCGPMSAAEDTRLYLVPSSLFTVTVKPPDNRH